MRTDSRLPRVLHVLLHLDQMEDPITSDMIGQMLGMNSSLVRRTMAGLRDAEFVNTTKGHGGGWFLVRPLTEITMGEVYRALGSPNLFAMGKSDDTPTCLLEKAANAATEAALSKAQNVFMGELDRTTVAALVEGSREQIRAFQNKSTER